MFEHHLIDIPPLIQHDRPFRTYETPNGDRYPSVTTILGAVEDKTALNEWRASVGEEEANRISEEARDRGDEVHKLCEDLVNNEDVNVMSVGPVAQHLFSQIRPAIERSVSNVRGVELQMWTDKYRTAGTADLIADWDGEPAIIDYKTSRKPKREDWIENYFMQAALYSCMLHERTGMWHKKIVIIIGIENTSYAQIFTGDVREWFPKAAAAVGRYYDQLR